jgi:flagellar hook-basal body protein
MDVIGNNIANVNTYGYKTSRATFNDVYYQTINAARPGDATRGGQNPTQVGYGAQLATIDVLMGNGGGSYTGRAMDVYLDGDGFLTVQDADGVFHYTRLGNMSIIDNKLVDSTGNFVMGINLDTEPTVETITAAAEDAAAAADAAAIAQEAAEEAAEAVIDAVEILEEANAEATEAAVEAATAKADADAAKVIAKEAAKVAESAEALLAAREAAVAANEKATDAAKDAAKAATDAAKAATDAAAALSPSNTGKAAAVAAADEATKVAAEATRKVNAAASTSDLNAALSDAAEAVEKAAEAVAGLNNDAANTAITTANDAAAVAEESVEAANVAAVALGEAEADFQEKAKITEAIVAAEAAELAAVAAEKVVTDAGADTLIAPGGQAVKNVEDARGVYEQAVIDAEQALVAVEAIVGLDSTDPGYATAAAALVGDPTYDDAAADLEADQLTLADAEQKLTAAQNELDRLTGLVEDATAARTEADALEALTRPEGVIAKAEETATAYAAEEALSEVANTASKEADAAARAAKVAHETAVRNAANTATKAATAAAKSAEADAIASVPPSGYATGKAIEPSGEGGFWTEDDMSAITFGLATVTVTGDDGTETEMELDVIDCITSINIGSDGKIYGITMRDFKYGPNDEMFQKDEVIYLGQLAVAIFPNQDGLSQTGMSQYDPSASSGNAQFTTADLNGAGAANSGYLEMSNVELSQQFTDMITTQRGFQANSRIVTVSDEMLQELINMKR